MTRRFIGIMLIAIGLAAAAPGVGRAAGLINDWSYQKWIVRFRAVAGGVIRGVVIDTPGGRSASQFGRTMFEVRPVKTNLYHGSQFVAQAGGVRAVKVSLSLSGDVLVVQQEGQPQPLVFRQVKAAAAPATTSGGPGRAEPPVKKGTDLYGFWSGVSQSTFQNYQLTLKKDMTYVLVISGGQGGLPFKVWGRYQVQGNQLILTHLGSQPRFPNLRFPTREVWRFKWLGPDKIETPAVTLTRWR
jgi:hypothetical protein